MYLRNTEQELYPVIQYHRERAHEAHTHIKLEKYVGKKDVVTINKFVNQHIVSADREEHFF